MLSDKQRDPMWDLHIGKPDGPIFSDAYRAICDEQVEVFQCMWIRDIIEGYVFYTCMGAA